MSGPTVKRLGPEDDLAYWAETLEDAEWDEDNAIEEAYTYESLARFVADPDNVFVSICDGDDFMGMASGRVMYRPYGEKRWLYVDEVDVAVNQRQRGAGRALVEALLRIGEEEDCAEVWLGTEHDNDPAIALYRSTRGAEEKVLGYTWAL